MSGHLMCLYCFVRYTNKANAIKATVNCVWRNKSKELNVTEQASSARTQAERQ